MIGEGFDIPTGRRVEESTMNMCLILAQPRGLEATFYPKVSTHEARSWTSSSGWAL